MNTRKHLWLLRFVQFALLAMLPLASQATVFGVQLGTIPPATVGPYAMTPFNKTPQNAIADDATVSQIPSPFGGILRFSPSATKFSVPATWNTWSDGYTGAVFYNLTPVTLSLPPKSLAFYFFYEGASASPADVTVTTSEGATLGPISVDPNGDAIGFAFYSDNPNVTLTTITIVSADPEGSATAEFGVSTNQIGTPVSPVPTSSPGGLAFIALILALGAAAALRKRV
jgi:hypothetical protein